jgi:hypothetical protein
MAVLGNTSLKALSKCSFIAHKLRFLFSASLRFTPAGLAR